MVARFREGLNRIQGGMLVRPFLPAMISTQFGEPSLALSVQLTSDDRRMIELPFSSDGRSLEMAEAALPADMRGVRADLAPVRHGELLAFFAEQPSLRSVELPPMIETTPASGGANLGKFSPAPPVLGVDYPTVAIIDGGVSVDALEQWKVGDAGLVPRVIAMKRHGTFIAGLVSAGSSLNPLLSACDRTRWVQIL